MRNCFKVIGVCLVLALYSCGEAVTTDNGPMDPSRGGGSQNTATLSWDPDSEPDLAGYKVYYGASPGTYETSIDVSYTTTYVVTNLESGTRYYFAITAYDISGNESAFSNEVFKDIP